MDLASQDSVASSYAQCLAFFLGACLSTAFIIVSTPKSGINSFVRYAWTVVILSNCTHLFQQVSATCTSIVINDVINGYLGFVILQCCNFLVITRLDENDLAKAGVFQSSGFAHKLFRAVYLIFNLRGNGTPWQIKRPNRFPRFFSRHSDNGEPTRASYVIRQMLIIAWQYLFLDVVFQSSLVTPPEDTQRLFGHGKEFIYFEATAEQLAARVVVSITSWLGPGRITIDLAYRGISVLAVVLGFTPPKDWPPLFGSIWDAYTIRGCWSTFWHQSFRWPLTSVSNFVCHNLLRLPPRSPLTRYLNVSIVFFVSGVVHLALDSFSPQPPPLGPTLAFFSSFSIAILIEEVVQDVCRRVTGVGTRDPTQSVPLWHKLVGYIWVGFWLTLTSPWFLYHATRLPPESKWLVPGSVVSSIGLEAGGALLVASGLVLKFAIGGEI
ncbi:membrane bound O-acyl transferase family-domain-containing protein [Dactylonectria macrodidyma]|uniref:Membrane bound O-acyl transferase family-domain-containing protein n=1 Tax=Dactylonectria macrodidyma TaxID=307937 RepID=A0A9P9FGL3_9HYPO|nr:membrane bound O-acyl transferase family-domain-containing protein [Dactylonectria macrodidyma]